MHALRQKTLNDKISSLKTSLDLQVKELELNMPLVEQGDIGANTIIKMKGRINEIRGEINSIINNFRKDAQEELTRLTDDLVLQQEILIEKKINLSRSDIESKMDAIVKDIVITTTGAKVRSGDVILELVPIGTELIIQAKLKPADIALVKMGQKAYIKFDAFDFTIFGLFMGTVEFVSPDTIKETTSRGEEFFYRVNVSIDQEELYSKGGKPLTITPGMGVQVDIVTGTRTVMQYLTKPVSKVLHESFKER